MNNVGFFSQADFWVELRLLNRIGFPLVWGCAIKVYIAIDLHGKFCIIIDLQSFTTDDDIVVESVVPSANATQTSDLSRMLLVVRRLATLRMATDIPAKPIVRECSSLGAVLHCSIRQEDIVIYNVGAVIHLNMEILATIVVAQVSADTSTLGHPIQPDPSACVMDPVILDQRVNGGMQFDTGHFCTAEGLVEVNVVDMVSSNLTEGTPHTAADSGRPTIVDRVVSDNVRPDLLL